MSEELRMFTVREVAEILRVSPRTVRRLIKRGEIKAVRVSRRLVRIPVGELRAYIARVSQSLVNQ